MSATARRVGRVVPAVDQDDAVVGQDDAGVRIVVFADIDEDAVGGFWTCGPKSWARAEPADKSPASMDKTSAAKVPINLVLKA